jgi:predicted membrane protein
VANPGRLLFGLILMVAGALFLLDLADMLDAGRIISTWWPLVFIAFGFVALSSSARSLFAAGVLFVAGTILLLANLDVFPVSAGELVLPIILMAVGAGILFVRSGPRRDADPNDTVNAFAAFGGQEVRSRSQGFKGGSATALFGGVTIDLRSAMLDPDGAGIDTFAAFGSVEIVVPHGWQVIVRGMPVFGGFQDSTAHDATMPDGAPTLTVSGVAAFGGVEVKNAPALPIRSESEQTV